MSCLTILTGVVYIFFIDIYTIPKLNYYNKVLVNLWYDKTWSALSGKLPSAEKLHCDGAVTFCLICILLLTFYSSIFSFSFYV